VRRDEKFDLTGYAFLKPYEAHVVMEISNGCNDNLSLA
jgi:hypothetical protein